MANGHARGANSVWICRMLSNALMQNAAFWCVCPAYTTTTTTARNYAKSLQRPDKPSSHSHPVPMYRNTNDTNPYGPDAAQHSRGRFLFLNLIWGLLHLQKFTFMFTLRIYMATSGKYIEWPNKYINAQNRFQCYISSRNTPIAIIKRIRILKKVARSDRFWYSWRQSIILLRTKICFRACRQ